MQPSDEASEIPSPTVFGGTPVQPFTTSNPSEATSNHQQIGAITHHPTASANPIPPTAVFGGTAEITFAATDKSGTSPTTSLTPNVNPTISPTSYGAEAAVQASTPAALSGSAKPQLTGQLSGQVSMHATSPLGISELTSERSPTKEFFKGVAIGVTILVALGALSFATEISDGTNYREITLDGGQAVGSHIEADLSEVNWEQVEYIEFWYEKPTPPASGDEGYYSTMTNDNEWEEWEDYSRGQITFQNYSDHRGEYREELIGGWESGNNTIWLNLDRDITTDERWTISIAEYSDSGEIIGMVSGLLCFALPVAGIIVLVKTAKTNKPKAWGMAASVIGAPFVIIIGSILILVMFGF